MNLQETYLAKITAKKLVYLTNVSDAKEDFLKPERSIVHTLRYRGLEFAARAEISAEWLESILTYEGDNPDPSLALVENLRWHIERMEEKLRKFGNLDKIEVRLELEAIRDLLPILEGWKSGLMKAIEGDLPEWYIENDKGTYSVVRIIKGTKTYPAAGYSSYVKAKSGLVKVAGDDEIARRIAEYAPVISKK